LSLFFRHARTPIVPDLSRQKQNFTANSHFYAVNWLI
jgi:hypothetical protein